MNPPDGLYVRLLRVYCSCQQLKQWGFAVARKCDLIGQRFGRLTVVGLSGVIHEKGNLRVWRCLCDCGNSVDRTTSKLRSGNTKSCGCLRADTARQNGVASGKHFGCKTRLYTIWRDMKARCENPKHVFFQRYGARGVTVCSEWEHDFSAFRQWALNNGYRDALRLDRTNNDGGYSPSNCRWVTQKEQCRNKGTNVRYGGKTVGEWAELTGLKAATIRMRLLRGWSVEHATSVSPLKAGETIYTTTKP